MPLHVATALRSARRRRILQVLLGVLVTLALAWFARHSLLVGTAALLVVEDPLVASEIMVVSNSMPRAAALEAALLYEQRISTHIVMADWLPDPLVDEIRGLGIPYLGITELSQAILERSGVPSSAITILGSRVDGTGSEVSAIVAFAQQRRPATILVITARSHTARTKWLLQRKMPHGVRIAVRSSRFDRFSTAGWWRQREQSREVITECLRWLNTAMLSYPWRLTPSNSEPTAALDLEDEEIGKPKQAR